MSGIIPEESKAKLRRFLELREKRDQDAEAAKLSEDEYRNMEAEVFDALGEDSGGVPVDLGPPWGKVTFGTRTTTYGQVLNEEEFQEWLDEHAMTAEMVMPKFSGRRLNELARNYTETGDDLPPGMGVYKRRGVSIRRQK